MPSHNNENTQSSSLKPGFGASISLVIFAVVTIAYLMLINVLGKIGLGETGMYGLVIAVPVAVFLISAFTTRTLGPGNYSTTKSLSGLSQFQYAGGAIGAVHNAMAGAAEWFSVFFIIGLIAALAGTNHDGLAMIIGAFFGFVFVTIAVLPKLAGQIPISFASTICLQIQNTGPGKNILRPIIAIVVILSATVFLVAQIGAGSQLINLYFPLTSPWAEILLITPVLLTILAGGMRGLTLANMMLYFIISAAIILPAVWLSLRITGNPVPQLSYGTGALQPMMELEQQLTQSVSGTANTTFEHGNFVAISGIADFLTTILIMMAGTVALPLLYTRISCISSSATRIRSVAWLFILVAAVLSVMPAFVTFMKFEYYRGLVGLPIEQLGESVDWLMKWAVIDGGRHALVCGSPAINVQAIITACGNGPSYVLMPNDLQFSSTMTLLASGEIADMPAIFSALIYAGVLSASATTAGIALMVIVNSATSDLIFSRKKQSNDRAVVSTQAPIARRLFISRLILIAAVAIGIWLSLALPVPKTDFSLWAFAIAAGAIFPVLLLAVWWKALTPIGALSGLLVGILISVYLLITLEFGPDWIAQNGDEPIFLLGGEALKPSNAAIIGMPAAFILAIVVSVIENSISKWRAKQNPAR